MDKRILFLIIILFFLSAGIVSASENITLQNHSSGLSSNVVINEESINNESSQIAKDIPNKQNTKIETKNLTVYYMENYELTGYIKTTNNQPVANKKVSVSINNTTYNKFSDGTGKVVLKLNLMPGTYNASFNFDGDDNYNASCSKSIVKVKKSVLTITAKNYRTYFESGFYFKTHIINKITKNPVKNVKVVFKVFTSSKKYKKYYATTDTNGIAKLKKNFKVGLYNVTVQIKKNKYIKANKAKSTLTIKETGEMGCSSLYVQVSNTEAVAGFRRDATNAKTLHIVKYKLNGKAAIKQYKTNSYFFHSLTTADGWMAGTGGWDNPKINHAIEKLVGKMVKSGKIKKSYLKKIQGYEKSLKIGHFSIKAPNGKYALVWGSGIVTGKLKPGEYIDVPNARSMFRHGSWEKFGTNPAKAAIKIAATDSFGVNRRDATAFHWKATTADGKTTSSLKVYAANDDGRLAGRSTAHLKDHVIFNGKFFSKNKLPKTPSSLLVGVNNFGSIDKLIKMQTTVKAPKLTKNINESGTFNISVKNKKTKQPIKNLKIKVKINKKVYSVKTDSKGVAHFKTNSLMVGKYDVLIYTDNIKYFINSKSKIVIT